jgi:hypothetical protein
MNSKLRQEVDGILQPGEGVLHSTFAQLKQGNAAKRLTKDVGVSLALTAATSVVGFGVMRNTVPPQVWVVNTDRRLLMYDKPDGHRSLGPLVFDAAYDELIFDDGTKLFGAVLIGDASNGQEVARLNLGLRRSAARRVVTCAGRQ